MEEKMIKTDYLRQEVEMSIVKDLSSIVLKQTQEDELYQISLRDIAKLIVPIFMQYLIGVAASETVVRYHNVIEQIENTEQITISQNDAVNMFSNTIDAYTVAINKVDINNNFVINKEELVGMLVESYKIKP